MKECLNTIILYSIAEAEWNMTGDCLYRHESEGFFRFDNKVQ